LDLYDFIFTGRESIRRTTLVNILLRGGSPSFHAFTWLAKKKIVVNSGTNSKTSMESQSDEGVKLMG
jgi:hypothetical protein